MSNGIDLEFLKNARREAFVTAFEKKIEKDNVVGYFGEIPEEIFCGCDLVAYPLEGVDSHIFQYGDEKNVCDVMKSTLIYEKTDKCPILYASNMYIFSDLCEKFYNTFKKRSTKEVYKFTDEKDLIVKLEKVYNTNFSEEKYLEAKEKLEYINQTLYKLDYFTDITTEEAFLLRYYTKYLELEKRYDYFKNLEKNITFKERKNQVKNIFVICPRGAYENVISQIKDDREIIRIYFSRKDLDFGYEYCPYDYKLKTNYGG